MRISLDEKRALNKFLRDTEINKVKFFKNFAKAIKEFDSVFLFPHINPDGDCIGCVLGMKELIRDNFPGKQVFAMGDSFGQFSFLPQEFDKVDLSFNFDRALAVILDVGGSARIQQFEKYFTLSKIKFGMVAKIDHHGMPSDFDLDLSWDDPTYVASAAQVVQIADYYGWIMSPKAATYLYLGICTDSQRFLFDNVLPRTLILAAKTWRAGADHKLIHDKLNRRSWEQIRLYNTVLSNCSQTSNVIWIYLDKALQKKLNIDRSKGLINAFQAIEEHWIWMVFFEQEDGTVKADFRSENVSVRDLAIKWGGGGHENAAGAQLPNGDNVQTIVNEADELVARAKKEGAPRPGKGPEIDDEFMADLKQVLSESKAFCQELADERALQGEEVSDE